MPYPETLDTRLVSFGKAVVIESGKPLAMKVSIKASRSLVHRPSGQPLVTVETIFRSKIETSEGALTLPICNSPDMGLGDGTSIDVTDGKITHTYTAKIQYLDPATLLPLGVPDRNVPAFVVLDTSPPIVDIDDIVFTTASTGEAIAIPDIWTHKVNEALAPSENSITLSSPAAALPNWSAQISIWDVPAATTVEFPETLEGFQTTVHVASGFSNISWPVGTTLYGSTLADDVWLTLIYSSGGWFVLIPDSASSAGSDTGWIVLSAGTVNGTDGTVAYTDGPPDFFSTGSPAQYPGFDLPFAVRIRRIGNEVLFWLPMSTPAPSAGVVLRADLIPAIQAGGFFSVKVPSPFGGDDLTVRESFVSTSENEIAEFEVISYEPISNPDSLFNIGGTAKSAMISGLLRWTTADPWPAL